jgi:hypothetical protein
MKTCLHLSFYRPIVCRILAEYVKDSQNRLQTVNSLILLYKIQKQIFWQTVTSHQILSTNQIRYNIEIIFILLKNHIKFETKFTKKK